MASRDDHSRWRRWSDSLGMAEGGAAGRGGSYATPHMREPSANTAPPLSAHRGDLAGQNRRLYLDNMRLWDCLAVFRSDPSMTCQGAINTIFSLNDNDYLREFPDTQQLLDIRYQEGALQHGNEFDPVTENTRLSEENARLHAAVWVLRDNPGLQADSTVAAVFRLTDAQFQRKFGQVNTGICRSSKNNNKAKAKALRTPLDIDPSTNMVHLVKKPVGPKRLSRAKSMSTSRQNNTGISLSTSRRRSESAQPLQDFSSNRKPTTAADMQNFHPGHQRWRSTSNSCLEKMASSLSENVTAVGAGRVLSDSKRPSRSCSSRPNCKTRDSPQKPAKPIKCVSFEEPMPRTTDCEFSERSTKIVSDIGEKDTNQSDRTSFKDRLQAILDIPIGSQSAVHRGTSSKDTKGMMKPGTSVKHTQCQDTFNSGETNLQVSMAHAADSIRDLGTAVENSVNRDQACRQETPIRRGSFLGVMCNILENSDKTKTNIGKSSKHTVKSRRNVYCPADEDDTDSETDLLSADEEGTGHQNTTHVPHFQREPSKRHKHDIHLSPVLDPRASLHRLDVSAGGESDEQLDRNHNRSPDEEDEHCCVTTDFRKSFSNGERLARKNSSAQINTRACRLYGNNMCKTPKSHNTTQILNYNKNATQQPKSRGFGTHFKSNDIERKNERCTEVRHDRLSSPEIIPIDNIGNNSKTLMNDKQNEKINNNGSVHSNSSMHAETMPTPVWRKHVPSNEFKQFSTKRINEPVTTGHVGVLNTKNKRQKDKESHEHMTERLADDTNENKGNAPSVFSLKHDTIAEGSESLSPPTNSSRQNSFAFAQTVTNKKAAYNEHRQRQSIKRGRDTGKSFNSIGRGDHKKLPGVVLVPQIGKRPHRPRSAGVREFNIARQANLKQSALHLQESQALFKRDSRFGNASMREMSIPKFRDFRDEHFAHDGKARSRVQAESRNSVGLSISQMNPPGMTISELTGSSSWFRPHGARSQDTRISMARTMSYNMGLETDAGRTPQVYMSMEPAPPRGDRHRAYPHRTYVTAKHFTDRHQRIMPHNQAPPQARRGISAILSFTREKSPSMAFILDEDFQRWMEGRVRASMVYNNPQELLYLTHAGISGSGQRVHHVKQSLERYPKVETPKDSIYAHISNPSTTREPIAHEGRLKGCSKHCAEKCAEKEAKLKLLKQLGQAKYTEALKTMIKRNADAPQWKRPEKLTNQSKKNKRYSE